MRTSTRTRAVLLAGVRPEIRLAAMARLEPDVAATPVCPLLGLAADRQTRFTFPHPDHRCHAIRPPAVIAPYHQSRYCLGRAFVACERYQARQHEAGASPPPQSPNTRVRPPAGPSRATGPGPAIAAAVPQVAAEPPDGRRDPRLPRRRHAGPDRRCLRRHGPADHRRERARIARRRDGWPAPRDPGRAALQQPARSDRAVAPAGSPFAAAAAGGWGELTGPNVVADDAPRRLRAERPAIPGQRVRPVDLRRQLAIVRAWFPLLVASVLLAGGAAFLFSSMQPKVYEAKATLIVGQSLSAVEPRLHPAAGLAAPVDDVRVRRDDDPDPRRRHQQLGLAMTAGRPPQARPGRRAAATARSSTSPPRTPIRPARPPSRTRWPTS